VGRPRDAPDAGRASQPDKPPYSGHMKTIRLTDAELTMVRHAMRTYLRTFGHEEADVVDEVKRILAKLTNVPDDDVTEKGSELIG
jgi:hypothetical protein